MKEAAVVIIVKDGLVLGISRRNNPNKFGLIGGKVSKGETAMEAAIRETEEETGLMIGNVFLQTERIFILIVSLLLNLWATFVNQMRAI